MDANSNFNQSLNGSFDLSQSFSNANALGLSGSFQGQQFTAGYQNMSPEELLRMQQINQQQIQQLTSQMAMLQNPQQNHVVTPTSPLQFQPQIGQVYIPNMMESPTLARNAFPAAVQPQIVPTTTNFGVMNSPVNDLQFSPNANSSQVYNPTAYPNTSTGINGQIHNQPNLVGQINTGQLKLPERNIATPNTLPLTHTNTPDTQHEHRGYQTASTNSPRAQNSAQIARNAVSDSTDGPIFMSRPRQQMSAPPPSISATFSPHSDKSSLSSTTSSPVSSSQGPISPDSSWSDASGPRSPEAITRAKPDSDLRSPIQNNPLHIKTRYPQDKCYSCMKKVYKMESMGPVKGVVYHKGCFRCKVCNTQLTMKNFNHSQSDSYDLAVYCKSHQPSSNEKGPKLDAESFEIKSALSAPKKGTVLPESERVPIRNYNIDMNSRDMEHARKAPVQNLQGGNKFRSNAWSKSKREQYHAPLTEVVRYDDPVSEVDPDSYNRHQVENSPDY